MIQVRDTDWSNFKDDRDMQRWELRVGEIVPLGVAAKRLGITRLQAGRLIDAGWLRGAMGRYPDLLPHHHTYVPLADIKAYQDWRCRLGVWLAFLGRGCLSLLRRMSYQVPYRA